MNRVNERRSFLLAALLSLSACATVPHDAPAYSRAPQPERGWANLYLFRNGAPPYLRKPGVLVDGSLLFYIPEGAYTVMPVRAGTHVVKIDWSEDTGWPDLEFPVTLREHEEMYVKIKGSSSQSESTGYFYSFGMLVNQADAEKEMRECCRYIAPVLKARKARKAR